MPETKSKWNTSITDLLNVKSSAIFFRFSNNEGYSSMKKLGILALVVSLKGIE